MQIVLLAAGLGSRLGSLTRDVPKALIDVAGRPLVEHCLRFCARVEPREIIVVAGFGEDQVRAAVARLGDLGGGLVPRLVSNPDFRQGNILSLAAARPHLRDSFVMMNVDHIYHPDIAAIVRRDADAVTGFIDTDRQLGADDMKVERDAQGRIKQIAKTLTTFDCGYVGMTRVPAARQPEYFAAMDAAIAADGTTIHVERILARLAEQGHGPDCRDISGHGWLEVDTPEERQSAEEALRAGRWKSPQQ